MSKVPQPPHRTRYLDGLRGVSALIVVFEHLSAFLPTGYWSFGEGDRAEVLSVIVNAPFRSGTFAVAIFFIISGFVTASSANGLPAWPQILVSRYLRLTLPMVFALIAAATLFALLPNQMPEVFKINPNHWTGYAVPPPSLWQAISQGLWGEYLYGRHEIISVIWSMRIELIGSMGVYTFYRFVSSNYRITYLILVAAILANTEASAYIAFPIGALLFEASERGAVPEWPALGSLLCCIGLALSVVAHFHRPHLMLPAGAASVVLGIALNRGLRRSLSTRVPRFLGRISYSLYLLHLPIMYSVFAALYLKLGAPAGGAILGLWLLAFISVSFAAAWMMTIFIEEPIAKFVRIRRAKSSIALLTA